MPLTDRFEPGAKQVDGRWGFTCEAEGGGRIAVKVTAEALEDTAPAGMGDQTKFDGNRATYLRIASDKFDKLREKGSQLIVVTNYDVQSYEHSSDR